MKRSLRLVILATSAFPALFLRSSQAATPMFSARHDYAPIGAEIAVGDVNGDGFPDIVGTGLNVLLGSKNGTFRSGPTSPVNYSSPADPVLADVNRDGILDFLVVAYVGPGSPPVGLVACLGNGNGTFQTCQFYNIGTNIFVGALAVGDFNGDGFVDVATQSPAGLWLFSGLGNGVFSAPALLPVAGATLDSGVPVTADFNEDGRLDIEVETNDGFAILLGNGNGTFQSAITVETGFTARWIHSADVNGDGYVDLLLVNNNVQTHAVFLFLGKGDGTFTGPTFPDMPGFEDIAVGDVNGDGKQDIVNSFAYLILGNGKGQFGNPVYYPTASAPLGTLQVFLADLRHTGRLDIVENNGALISVILNQGKGKFEDGELITAPAGAGCGVSADFNRDGKPDLAVNTSSGVSIFLGTGNALSPFTSAPTIPSSSGATCLAEGDLNNDGIPDLLFSVYNPPPATNGNMLAYLGNGDGTFRQASSTTLATLGYIATGDFNHDGNLDYATSANLLALGNGDGTFQAAAPFIPPSAPPVLTPYFIASADLNHDGWTDLVLTDSEHNLICVLINNRQGGFTSKNIVQSSGPLGVTFADLNGDGNVDLVVAFFYLGAGAVYLGDGQGNLTYKSQVTFPIDFAAFPTAADINGDGIPDLEMACESTTVVFTGKGDGTFGTPFLLGTGPSPGNAVPMNLHGQSAASGTPDLVYPDQTGLIYVLINQTR